MPSTNQSLDGIWTEAFSGSTVRLPLQASNTGLDLASPMNAGVAELSSGRTTSEDGVGPTLTHGTSTRSQGRSSSQVSDRINTLPPEAVLECLSLVVDAELDAGSLLGYFHVCSHWRRLMTGDRALCANVAFKFSRVKLIEKFLKDAGAVPQHIDCDTLILREDISMKNKLSVISFLVEDKHRLSNAISIKSLLPLPQCRWFSQLRSISNFCNLMELHVRIFTLNDLPSIHAPKLRSLTVVANEQSLIPVHRFVNFIQGLPSLVALSLDSIGSDPQSLGVSAASSHFDHLQKFSMSNVQYSQYESMRRFFSDATHKAITSLSFYAPCRLECIWDSIEICNRSPLQATLSASENMFQLDLHDPDSSTYCRELDASIRLSIGVGYLRKLYNSGPQTSVDEDILHDVAVYADKIDVVSLSAGMHSDWVAPLLLNEVTGMKVISWLQALPHPTVLVIDSSSRVLVERGVDYIWPSLSSIHIHCRTHRLSLREDDQAAVDAVAGWLRSPVLSQEMHVTLLGKKWKHYNLVLGDLIDHCADFVDWRI